MTDQRTSTTGTAEDRPLIDALVAGLPALDLKLAAGLLDQLHARLDSTEDPAVIALLSAIDALGARWRVQHDQLSACWQAHVDALSAEGLTRSSLISVLHTMSQLIPAVSQQAVSPPSPSTHRVTHSAEPSNVPAPQSVNNSTKSATRRLPEGAGAIEIAVCLLGPFALFQQGRAIGGWRGTKTPRIVRYLTARCGQPTHRERLIEMFWPDADTETGRRSLHQAIYLTRRALQHDNLSTQHIVYENEAYMINRELGFWCDIEEFEARVTAGRRAERTGRPDDAMHEYELAARLYGGDLLEDTPHEDWALTERDRLRLLYVRASNHLAELRLARGESEAALEISQQILRHAPCDEVAHRRAMRCFADTGRRGLAAQQYRTCTDLLADSLDLTPSPETTQLYLSLVGSDAGPSTR